MAFTSKLHAAVSSDLIRYLKYCAWDKCYEFVLNKNQFYLTVLRFDQQNEFIIYFLHYNSLSNFGLIKKPCISKLGCVLTCYI